MSSYIQPPSSNECVWHTGFPEHPGWYPASFKFPPDPSSLRYYFGDGKWSASFGADTSADYFELFGEPVPLEEQRDDIMWADPWWETKESSDATIP